MGVRLVTEKRDGRWGDADHDSPRDFPVLKERKQCSSEFKKGKGTDSGTALVSESG